MHTQNPCTDIATLDITNVQYYASKVEEKIDIVTNEKNEEVVAILDPPRNGVHTSVIRAVRESEQIQKVIFISCDAKQAMQNFIGYVCDEGLRFLTRFDGNILQQTMSTHIQQIQRAAVQAISSSVY